MAGAPFLRWLEHNGRLHHRKRRGIGRCLGASGFAEDSLDLGDRLQHPVLRLEKLLRMPLVPGEHPHLAQTREELARYFAGTLKDFTVPLVFRGTPFEERVWRELVKIPYGDTISYAEMATRVASPGAQRAVGRANGMNRISIVIPCHRVVNADGKLGGYGGGLWRKHWLLALERKQT